MGVTIFYEGQLESENQYNELINFAVNFAEENNLPYKLFKDQKNTLIKSKNGKIVEDDFNAKGIFIRTHKNSDPLLIEFDDDLHTQGFCKTQFAGVETHKMIINFFRNIEGFFKDLKIIDEGQYWETKDESLLKDKMDFIAKMIDEIQAKYEEEKNKKWKYN